MSKLILGFALVGSISAFGMNSYDSTAYTCEDLKAIVKAEKLVLFEHSMGGGKYTVHKKYCDPVLDKDISNSYIPASDTDFCNPGILCKIKFPGE